MFRIPGKTYKSSLWMTNLWQGECNYRTFATWSTFGQGYKTKKNISHLTFLFEQIISFLSTLYIMATNRWVNLSIMATGTCLSVQKCVTVILHWLRITIPRIGSKSHALKQQNGGVGVAMKFLAEKYNYNCWWPSHKRQPNRSNRLVPYPWTIQEIDFKPR